jgi:hypothetical protein
MTSTPTNPVVKTTALRAYPGWTVREYADGMFDAVNSPAISPGFDNFNDTVAHVREQASAAPACGCPDDCNCRKPWRMNYCGCRAH